MPLHYGPGDYDHLIGKKVGGLIIDNIEYKPDNIYIETDGYAGNPHLLTLSNGDTLLFRHFEEVVKKYGSLEK
jgi:hypothetical protein